MVGQVVGQLDTPVHRPRVHHDRVVLGVAKLGAVHAEGRRVLAQAREEGPGEPLELDPENAAAAKILEQFGDGAGGQ